MRAAGSPASIAATAAGGSGACDWMRTRFPAAESSMVAWSIATPESDSILATRSAAFCREPATTSVSW